MTRFYLAWAVPAGAHARFVGAALDAETALRVARCHACGDAVSVNREDVPPPSLRASEVLAGVGDKLSIEENVRRANAQRGAELAYARWARKHKRTKERTA